jgi:restriction system protein
LVLEDDSEDVFPFGSVSLENDLRDYLATNISSIEKGLTLIGKEYDTKEAGRIDLLCKDKNGTSVVIELKKGRKSDEVVGQILRYIGWVMNNQNPKVRGIIIVNEPDGKLEFAVVPLKNLIEIKYYKVKFEISSNYT